MSHPSSIPRERILGHPVDAIGRRGAVRAIIDRALTPTPGAYVCLSNMHTTLLSRDLPSFRAAVEGSFLSLPDGMPLARLLRHRGFGQTEKIPGPDLVPQVVAAGRAVGLRHFLYGWTPAMACAAGRRLAARAPGAEIVGVDAPPFAQADSLDDGETTPLAPAWVDIGGPVREVDWRLEALEAAVAATRPHVLWVGLGAPVQEEWMAMVAGRLDVPVMIGVGRAFNNLAGSARQAPALASKLGLEWLFVMLSEPRRLWRRYVFGIPRFLYLLAQDAVAARTD